MLKKDTKYKITMTDGDAIVTMTKVDTYSSGLPTDYWFDYVEGSEQPLIHDDFPNQFILPEGLIHLLLEKGLRVEMN